MKPLLYLAVALMMVACDGRVMLEGFPTLQQTTDYTCGPVAAEMVMRYYGFDESEEALAVKMHTHTDSERPDAKPGSAVKLCDYGTNVEEIYRYFDGHKDFNVVASSYAPLSMPAGRRRSMLTDTALVGIQAVGNVEPTFNNYGEAALFFKEQLRQGRPVMVCWNLWGGHWTVCIGYDDHGTPDFYEDDCLTMADPYDSTDGTADGLTEVSLVAFFYDWFCAMTPKPWQLQPYIIVSPR